MTESGFSLLEAVFALGLFSLCMLATIQMAGMIFRTNQLARDFDAALYLAENKMEEIISRSYSDILDCDEPNGCAGVPGGSMVFQRRVRVSEQANPQRKTITVTVSWWEGDAHRVELASIILP